MEGIIEVGLASSHTFTDCRSNMSKTYKSSAFKAWCMKDGVHGTKAKPFVSWNAQLLEPVANDLTQEFARHDATVSKLANQCSIDLRQLVHKIDHDIKGSSANN